VETRRTNGISRASRKNRVKVRTNITIFMNGRVRVVLKLLMIWFGITPGLPEIRKIKA
jgi:hypothetical protein